MTGPEHYREAEILLGEARGYPLGSPSEITLLANAQVHATLALAAATALVAPAHRPDKDWSAWYEAASEYEKGDEAR
ncbi:MAG TPA: hypothetical protein VJ870_04615 [Amycolatopsis sp.]|nr:hypothetical protein [Amycolatopsis sp.]